MDLQTIRDDLLAEQAALDEIVAGLDDEDWATPTPSPRWDVSDQIAHLTYFDRRAAQAITDHDGFQTEMQRLFAEGAGGDEAMDALTLDPVRTLPIPERLEAWRAGRRELALAAETLGPDTRVEWYGPSMGAKSFLTARIMEVWAHGTDIVDAVGAVRTPTDRLRHIAQLGVITRGWSYVNRGLEPPDVEVGVGLVAPSGERWTWGPDDATNRVEGDAEQFCLVVTQRRHVDDTDLVVRGPAAGDWMRHAQAFAGPPSEGPASPGVSQR